MRSKLTMKTLERLSTVFVVNFEHVSHLFLLFLLLTLNRHMFTGFHSISLRTLKNTAAITDRYTIILVKLQLIKLWSKVAIPKTIFFPRRLLYSITGTSFFQSSFPFFTKVVAVIHSSIDTVFFRRALAAMTFVYTLYLTDISI